MRLRPTPRVLKAVAETPWAILPSKLAEIVGLLARHKEGIEISAEELQAARAQKRSPAAQGSVAIIPIVGTIVRRADMFSDISGGTSSQSLAKALKQYLADDTVGAIVLDVDSPGGEVGGVEDLAKAVFEARERKPIIAVANTLMTSAAYWIGSASSELVVSPSATVGSIGVWVAHEDWSRNIEEMGVGVTLLSAGTHKTVGNPFEALSEEARALIQGRVDESYAAFVRDVAKHRGVKPKAVREGFGAGFVVGAKEAIAEGMADRIATFDETIERLMKPWRARGGGAHRAQLATLELEV